MSSISSCKKSITVSIRASHGGVGKIIKKTVWIPILLRPGRKFSPSVSNERNIRLEQLGTHKFLSTRKETLSQDESDEYDVEKFPSSDCFRFSSVTSQSQFLPFPAHIHHTGIEQPEDRE